MGVFKKIHTCKQCGREYEVRLNLGGDLCGKCQTELKEMEKAVPGEADMLKYVLDTASDTGVFRMMFMMENPLEAVWDTLCFSV